MTSQADVIRTLASTPRKPGKPGKPKATKVGDRQVTLTWSAASANGAKVKFYQVVGSRGVAKRCYKTTCTIKGLKNNKTYYFKVRARNAKGYGNYGTRSAAIVPNYVPPAPSGVAVEALDGGGKVTFTYSGRALRYVQVRVDGGSWQRLPDDGLIQGLTNGRTYTAQLRACVWICGTAGQAATFVPYGPPGVATNLKVIGSPTSAGPLDFSKPVAKWCAAPTNGRPIVRYEMSFNLSPWAAAGEPYDDPAYGECFQAPVSWSAFGSSVLSVRAVDTEGTVGPVVYIYRLFNITRMNIELAPVAAAGGCADPCYRARVTLENEYYPGLPQQEVSINSGARTCVLTPATGTSAPLDNGSATLDSPACLVTGGDVLTATRSTTFFGRTLTARAVAPTL